MRMVIEESHRHVDKCIELSHPCSDSIVPLQGEEIELSTNEGTKRIVAMLALRSYLAYGIQHAVTMEEYGLSHVRPLKLRRKMRTVRIAN